MCCLNVHRYCTFHQLQTSRLQGTRLCFVALNSVNLHLFLQLNHVCSCLLWSCWAQAAVWRWVAQGHVFRVSPRWWKYLYHYETLQLLVLFREGRRLLSTGSRPRHSARLSQLGSLAWLSSSLKLSTTLMLSLADDSMKLWFQSSSTVDSTSLLFSCRSLWRSILLPITTIGVNLSSLTSRISSRRLLTASRDWGSSTA